MQRAAQKEEKGKKEEEVTPAADFLSSGIPKKWYFLFIFLFFFSFFLGPAPPPSPLFRLKFHVELCLVTLCYLGASRYCVICMMCS